MKTQRFIDPEQVLVNGGLKPGMVLADLGAGNGFFAIHGSHIVGDRGFVWAVDILEEALGHVMSQARLERRKNIRTIRADLDRPQPSAIPDLSCDFVFIGKLLPQLKHPEYAIRETWRILKTGGLILISEWRKDAVAFGPPAEERLTAEQVKEMFGRQGFKYVREYDTDHYHFAVLLQK
ncbi:MAG: hypothetical protein A2722_02135 [Candidatus Doudnabacteria bacterium RIFCSPHIGHO2_01_FULL_50_11]|uniref:Methyltransferase type 11 domain-containing protein n=1 Tax=Candidatus Doudnabacteria bacterium RIFCSPHIGHO2_01_FULL_50_11 TaxID=1817828 RepID=A0A1F5PIV2_9BACT|nr:MAG: hypothetical protein A2722_02135 [Candidatus Doudnabacteria bacterium RIFCSPHIGHO2_01_FULL_50_11]